MANIASPRTNTVDSELFQLQEYVASANTSISYLEQSLQAIAHEQLLVSKVGLGKALRNLKNVHQQLQRALPAVHQTTKEVETVYERLHGLKDRLQRFHSQGADSEEGSESGISATESVEREAIRGPTGPQESWFRAPTTMGQLNNERLRPQPVSPLGACSQEQPIRRFEVRPPTRGKHVDGYYIPKGARHNTYIESAEKESSLDISHAPSQPFFSKVAKSCVVKSTPGGYGQANNEDARAR